MSVKSDLSQAQKYQELQLKEAQKSQTKFQMEVAKNQDKVPVRIGLMYATKIGKTLPVTINGVTISIPCDGNSYMIPRMYADIVDAHLKQIDLEISRASKELFGERGDLSPTGKVPGKE